MPLELVPKTPSGGNKPPKPGGAHARSAIGTSAVMLPPSRPSRIRRVSASATVREPPSRPHTTVRSGSNSTFARIAKFNTHPEPGSGWSRTAIAIRVARIEEVWKESCMGRAARLAQVHAWCTPTGRGRQEARRARHATACPSRGEILDICASSNQETHGVAESLSAISRFRPRETDPCMLETRQTGSSAHSGDQMTQQGTTPDSGSLFASFLDEHAATVRSAVDRVWPRQMGIRREELEQEVRLRLWKTLENEREITDPASFIRGSR